ncbi:hypothetical protein ACWDTP_21205 [Mycobacterium sp. NPDC003449]
MTTADVLPRSRRRRRRLAAALFVFSPFVGECVLGNMPLTEFPFLLMLAPMYGAGALLIREVARRTGGWPMIIPLAAAYALIEEGVVDQMLFNPNYLGLDSFAGYGLIPGIGMSASLTEGSLVLHTVWSICVPIAVVEAFDDEPTRPWLGRVGLGLIAAVFVLGCIGLGLLQYTELRFTAGPFQFGLMGIAIAALIAVAVRNWRHGAFETRPHGPPAPCPRTVAVAAFGMSSGYWLIEVVAPRFGSDWTVLACAVAWVTGCGVVLARYACRPGWIRTHIFAVAAGTLLTYVWVGFTQSAALDVPRSLGLIGNAIFGAGAIVVLAFAARAEHRRTVRAPVDGQLR